MAFRSQPDGPLAGERAHDLVARSGHLATGTLACPRCDAPVALAGRATPRDRIGCPYCDHSARVRDFLSLDEPTRPARVTLRVVRRY